jgi:serine phosphatase RsbU (regulator of sigma subunit)
VLGVLTDLHLRDSHDPDPLPVLMLGHIPVSTESLFFGAYPAALLLIVLLRTVRINRDHQRAVGELEAARTVQQILVPEAIPTVAGFNIQSAYRPAQEVAGDFFQIIPLDAGGVLVVVGDVSGKGLKAAMTVSLVVGAIRTLVEQSVDPAMLLEGLNRRLLGRSDGGFTTCLALHLDAGGALLAANAGHISPYRNGAELAVAASLPLGLVAEPEYRTQRFELAPGDHLALLSDGVVEARNSLGELLGFERTEALCASDAAQIADAAVRFGQDDDITVVTIDFNPAIAARPETAAAAA